MRVRTLVFGLAFVAAFATAVQAQTPPPPPAQPSGQCNAGSYLVRAAGPTLVMCPNETSGTNCTQIEYWVSGSNAPDHVAAVVASGSSNCLTPSIASVFPSGNQIFAPGVGDTLTGLGKWSCHDEAVKINPNGAVTYFKVVVSGERGPAPKSVVVKKGNTTRSCEIVGIGETPTGPNPFSTNLKIETLVFKGCAVTFEYNLTTGDVVTATPDPTRSTLPDCAGSGGPFDEGECCEYNLGVPVSELTLYLEGENLGSGQFGEGYISSGSNSCTTRVIGGKVYTWGSPCP